MIEKEIRFKDGQIAPIEGTDVLIDATPASSKEEAIQDFLTIFKTIDPSGESPFGSLEFQKAHIRVCQSLDVNSRCTPNGIFNLQKKIQEHLSNNQNDQQNIKNLLSLSNAVVRKRCDESLRILKNGNDTNEIFPVNLGSPAIFLESFIDREDFMDKAKEYAASFPRYGITLLGLLVGRSKENEVIDIYEHMKTFGIKNYKTDKVKLLYSVESDSLPIAVVELLKKNGYTEENWLHKEHKNLISN